MTARSPSGPVALLRAADAIVDAATEEERIGAVEVYRALRACRHDVYMARPDHEKVLKPWCVVDELRKRGPLALPALADRLGVSASTTQRYLRGLLDYGIVVKDVISNRHDVRYRLASAAIGAADIVSALEPDPAE